MSSGDRRVCFGQRKRRSLSLDYTVEMAGQWLGKKPASGEVLTDFVYSWTNGSGQDTGLRQSVTDKNGIKTSYTYDALSRLTRAEERSSAGALLNSWAYSYDANSNRTSQTVNGVTTSYSHNAADQLTATGSTTYSYDGNGNELSNSAGRQWTYNTKDQAVSVTPPGASAISMSYTGTGQFERVSAGSTVYDTSALGLTRENLDAYVRDDAGLLLLRKTPGSGTHYYLLDGLGSVAALTDSLGNLAATYSYEPFGKLKSSTGTVANPYRWLGGLGVYHDQATGLYKMGTRYYDPTLGRFTQSDPVEGGSLNRYDYAAQDPINIVDVDGRVVVALMPVAVAATRLAIILVRYGPRLASAARALRAFASAIKAGSKQRIVSAARAVARGLASLRVAYRVFKVRRMAACVDYGRRWYERAKDIPFIDEDVAFVVGFSAGCLYGFARGFG